MPHLQLLTRKTKQGSVKYDYKSARPVKASNEQDFTVPWFCTADVRVSALYDVTKGAAPAAEPPTTTPVAEAAASGVTAPPSAPGG